MSSITVMATEDIERHGYHFSIIGIATSISIDKEDYCPSLHIETTDKGKIHLIMDNKKLRQLANDIMEVVGNE